MQIGDLLITESQLNTRLNKSVHEKRRGELMHSILANSIYQKQKLKIQLLAKIPFVNKLEQVQSKF